MIEGHVPKNFIEGIAKLQNDTGITPDSLVPKVADTSGERVQAEQN